MVTTEYTVTFNEEIGEFHLMLLGKALGVDFAIPPNFRNIVIESNLDERDFLRILSENVDVKVIGLIEHKRTLEPNWIEFNESNV